MLNFKPNLEILPADILVPHLVKLIPGRVLKTLDMSIIYIYIRLLFL
jgi:hypothetical protein